MADQKLTQLDAATTLADDDLVYVVDDVAGTPGSKKLTGANLKASFSGAYVAPGDDAATLGSDTATDGHVLTADGAGGAAWEAAAGGGSSDPTPVGTRIDIPVWVTRDETAGSISLTAGSAASSYLGVIVLASSSQDGVMGWDVYLGAGTWTLEFVYARNTDSAIITPSVGGTALTGLDTYNATLNLNNYATYTGIVVGTGGTQRVKFTAATRNASATGWFQRISAIHLVRTA